MISGASDEELDIAIARADVLLELQPKIDELKKENQELKKQLVETLLEQQKEFIEWLEKESKELIRDAGYHQRICLDILEKYKEIIGDKDE